MSGNTIENVMRIYEWVSFGQIQVSFGVNVGLFGVHIDGLNRFCWALESGN